MAIRILIVLVIGLIQFSCKDLTKDEAQPTIIKLVNKEAVDFQELIVNGRKDSSGTSVVVFSSIMKDAPNLSIDSQPVQEFYLYKDKLAKGVGGSFEIQAKTPDQRILKKEFGEIYLNKERVEYVFEISNNEIVQVK